MKQMEELKDKMYVLVNAVIDESNNIRKIDKAISLLEKLSHIEDSKRIVLNLEDSQKEELQTKIYNKTLLIIEKATEELSSEALHEVDMALSLFQKTIY